MISAKENGRGAISCHYCVARQEIRSELNKAGQGKLLEDKYPLLSGRGVHKNCQRGGLRFSFRCVFLSVWFFRYVTWLMVRSQQKTPGLGVSLVGVQIFGLQSQKV